MRIIVLTICLLGLNLLGKELHAQSAAMQKVAARYSSEQLADLQSNTPYKYQGLLLFYSDSWLVNDQGLLRVPTEQEITAIDLDHYTPARSETNRVAAHDAATGLDIVLLGRGEFENLYLARLNPTDKQAYLAYKALFSTPEQKEAQ